MAVVDFPISLSYFLVGDAYSNYLDNMRVPGITQFFYPPYVIHGLLGAIWWLFLPRLLMPKRLGGIWGKPKVASNGSSELIKS